jgi:hypothetical protein
VLVWQNSRIDAVSFGESPEARSGAFDDARLLDLYARTHSTLSQQVGAMLEIVVAALGAARDANAAPFFIDSRVVYLGAESARRAERSPALQTSLADAARNFARRCASHIAGDGAAPHETPTTTTSVSHPSAALSRAPLPSLLATASAWLDRVCSYDDDNNNNNNNNNNALLNFDLLDAVRRRAPLFTRLIQSHVVPRALDFVVPHDAKDRSLTGARLWRERPLALAPKGRAEMRSVVLTRTSLPTFAMLALSKALSKAADFDAEQLLERAIDVAWRAPSVATAIFTRGDLASRKLYTGEHEGALAAVPLTPPPPRPPAPRLQSVIPFPIQRASTMPPS